MARTPTVHITFKDMDAREEVREALEARLQTIAEEFHETTRFEVTLSPDGVGHEVHAHVTGKGTDLEAQATAEEVAVAADAVLDRIERQLRKAHDKRIFTQRRKSQKSPPKKQT